MANGVFLDAGAAAKGRSTPFLSDHSSETASRDHHCGGDDTGGQMPAIVSIAKTFLRR